MLPLTDAQAEAGKAVAETTGKALDLTKGIGSFIAETIGTIPQDLLGLAGGDWLHEKRQRNLAQMQAKTARILEGIEKERISEPSPSVVVPLLEAAKDEGREELQGFWAALLAAAMLDGGKKVRRQFFDVLRDLEPEDIPVLKKAIDIADRFSDEDWQKHGEWETSQPEDDLAAWFDASGMTYFELTLANEHLTKLGLLNVVEDRSYPTALARALLQACEVIQEGDPKLD